MSLNDIAALAKEILLANRDYSVLPGNYLDQMQHPEVRFLTDLLVRVDPGKWDRILDQFRTPGQATLVLNEVFTPRGPIPSALIKIYDVLESERGVIVSYNYDRLTDHQKRFKVITPHGQRSSLLSDPATYATRKLLIFELGMPLPSDWWLPAPEKDTIRQRHGYQEALIAWRRAEAIVFIGYGFGAGADELSFEDFGKNASVTATIHVLSPKPDNADLCKQIGHGLKNRGPGFRVVGHPFRWRPFAEALLEELDMLHANHIRKAIGREVEIGERHDRKTDPRAA